MLEIVGIDHIVLRTQNLDSMLAFYQGILGCQIERELKEEGLTQLRAGNALIDIVNVDSPLGRLGGRAPRQDGRNVDHFCLQVRGVAIASLKAHLKAHGVDVLPEAKRYGATGFGLSLYVNDPEQNVVELKPC